MLFQGKQLSLENADPSYKVGGVPGPGVQPGRQDEAGGHLRAPGGGHGVGRAGRGPHRPQSPKPMLPRDSGWGAAGNVPRSLDFLPQTSSPPAWTKPSWRQGAGRAPRSPRRPSGGEKPPFCKQMKTAACPVLPFRLPLTPTPSPGGPGDTSSRGRRDLQNLRGFREAVAGTCRAGACPGSPPKPAHL